MTVDQVVRYTQLARRRSELNPANVEHDAEIAAIMAELKELRKLVDEEHERRKRGTDIEIITPADIVELYGFKRDEVYKLLKVKGCPVLPRSETAPYRLIKDEFERWLRSRRV